MSNKSLGTLTLDLVAQTGGFVQGMSKAQRTSKSWRRDVERDLKKVGKAFAVMGAAAVGTLTALTKQGMSFVDSQAKTSAQLGTTIDDLRAVQIAASDFGIQQGKLESSLASYTKRLGDAARGTGEAQKAYEALGLEAKDLINLPLPEQLAIISQRLAQVDSAAEKTSIADRLMSGGRGLVNLFNDGGDAIQAAAQEVDEFGLSLSAVDASKVEATNDSLSRIPRLLEPIKNQLAVAMAEPLQGITQYVLEAAKETKGFKQEIEGLAEGGLDAVLFVIDAFDGLKRAVQLTGRFAALMVIEFQRDLAKLAEFIYSGPIDAINALIERMNALPGIDLGGGFEQPAFVKDLQDQVALFERASKEARQDMHDILMQPMASQGIRDSIDAAGRTLDGEITEGAIAGARATAEALERTAQASNDAEGALNNNAAATDEASRAATDFSRAAVGGMRAINAASRDWSGDPGAYGAERATTVRERIDSRRDPGVINYQANPNAKSNWGGSAGASRMNASASSAAGSDNGTRRNIGVLTLKSDDGEINVEANSDELEKWLTNALSGAAAAK